MKIEKLKSSGTKNENTDIIICVPWNLSFLSKQLHSSFSHVLRYRIFVWRFLPCLICFDTASFIGLIFCANFLFCFFYSYFFALFYLRNFLLVFHLSNFSSADFLQHFVCFDSARFLLVQPLSSCLVLHQDIAKLDVCIVFQNDFEIISSSWISSLQILHCCTLALMEICLPFKFHFV